MHRALEILLLGEAERDVVVAERAEHILVEPALVPELDRKLSIGREQAQEAFESGSVLLHVRRQLEQNRSQSGAERGGVLQQEVDAVGALRLEPRIVRDALARLDRERELLGHLRGPLPQHVLFRHPVERVVDLDGGKPRGVVAEPAIAFQVVRVERPLPLLERIAARAREQLHDTMRPALAASGFSVFARLALSASMRSRIFPLESGWTSDVMS